MPSSPDNDEQPVASAIAASLRRGESNRAAALVKDLLAATVGQSVTDVEFTNDEYSLNSVSGRADFSDQTVRFFKFHTEEGEQSSVSEYYRAQLLADAGLPVDVPVAMSSLPGSQLAVYALRTDRRMADVCLDLERRDGPRATLPAPLLTARHDLDGRIAAVMVGSLRASPHGPRSTIHQLFGNRLLDPADGFPGGRFKRWYVDHPDWSELGSKTWRINDIDYPMTLADIGAAAAGLLNPDRFDDEPVVLAHGDDHHGNLWVTGDDDTPRLVMFDPAFAADDIPALLAPIKATFHNALAHPFWLYHPDEAAQRTPPTVDVSQDCIQVGFEPALSPLRQAVLDSACALVWTPLLVRLAASGQLNPDWRSILRMALFACPMLVTNLLAPTRPAAARWSGLAHAVMAGCEPHGGQDPISRMLDRLADTVAVDT